MLNTVNVRLHGRGKPQRFVCGDTAIAVGEYVVVESDQGMEFGAVVTSPIAFDESILDVNNYVVRLATAEDIEHFDDNQRLEAEALDICKKRIEHFKLDMNLVDAQYLFDNRKLIFYFMADGRVDFRELVKDLASIFRVRIELRQIGVRDEARLIGGVGQCGRELCCASFLNDFHPVTIKMVKEQNLSMNPQKISGACGRLLCCLNYEQEAYEDLNQRMPARKSVVRTPYGKGIVIANYLLKELVQVKLEGEDTETVIVPLADVEVLVSAKRKKGSART